MRLEDFKFGRIRIDGVTYKHDVVIQRGHVRKRRKKPSKRYRDLFGHTPVSVDEAIPWRCRQLIIGTGESGALPVMEEVKLEAKRRHVELVIQPTAQAIETLKRNEEGTCAILHVTC
ncbi:MAG TPA: MTH938/NDUFAF3 family protein [Anaeromyxobacteraceae bacterium]|nr:MTH938/NDUFAF3 family protein [Anaeromyxobacteraceae bacterium]